ncbi:hypothetical protein [Mesorhizobium sp. LjNodule214]|uniref:hypothetical protein n=1 Tax=Mesorhizobium sp. LjNodule214 TaxID=3342252 RepID=UPI003ED07091
MGDEPQIEEMYGRSPLLAFSLYTVAQLQSLQRIRSEILAAMDQREPGPDLMKAYDFFWFWTLGAYEIVRTMDENKSCFSTPVAARINALKLRLALIRMPFAKQLFANQAGLPRDRPIGGENSIADVGQDQSLIFEIGGETFDSRSLIGEVTEFFAGIKREDILRGMKCPPP